MLEISITGIEEVLDALKELPTAAMERTVLTNSLKKSVKPLIDEANANKPSTLPGDSVRASTRRRRGQSYGPGMAFVNIVYAHPLAHLFEFGTVERYTKGGAYRGVMTARPHVRPAYDANSQKVVDIFSEEIITQLDKAGERLRKRAEAGKLTKGQIRGLQRSSR